MGASTGSYFDLHQRYNTDLVQREASQCPRSDTVFRGSDKEVWNLKKAYSETCLCRTCFNNRLFCEGLAVVAELIEILLLPSTSQDADVADAEVADGGPQDEPSSAEVENLEALRELHSFCASCATGQRSANEKLVCVHQFHDSRFKCLSDKCDSCGFKALWMPVRKTLETTVAETAVFGLSHRVLGQGDASSLQFRTTRLQHGTIKDGRS